MEKNMYVSNMISNCGNAVPNQFVITDNNSDAYFQSYNSMIARRIDATDTIELDENFWNYSATTSKYLARFLGVPNKEIKQKVKSGEYKLVNLNVKFLDDNLQIRCIKRQEESLEPLFNIAGKSGNLLTTY